MAPKDDTDSDIHDYSTCCGRFQLVLQRIQSLWMKLLLVGINAAVIVLVLWSVYSAPKEEINLKLSKDSFEALPLKSYEAFDALTGSYVFNGPIFDQEINVLDKSLVKSFKLVDSIIADAALLKDSLTGMTNLESIVIQVYQVNGTFQRVHLPSLKEFNFTLRNHNAKAEDFKSPETLKQILFFDKHQSGEADWGIFELFNRNVSVSLWISGTVLIESSAGHGLVNIDTPYCEELLTEGQKALKNTTKLIMSWCPVTDVSVVPRSVEYLSLNNAVPTPVDRLSSLLTRLELLQELHIYLPFLNYDEGSPSYYVTPQDPERQNQVDLAEVSPRLKSLSVVRAGLKWGSEEEEEPTTAALLPNSTSIEELSVQEGNISSRVISNFARVFPKLKVLRLFNASGMPDNVDVGKLLSSVLALSSVNSLVVTGYPKRAISKDQDVHQLPVGVEHFAMERSEGGWTTSVLNETQVDTLRFDHLKFTDVYRRGEAPSSSADSWRLIGGSCLFNVVVIAVTVVWNCGFDKIWR